MDEMRCEAGCKSFTGGERQHRRDCAFYPESLTKIWHDTEDNLTAEIARLRAALFQVSGYLNGALLLAGHADTTDAQAAVDHAAALLTLAPDAPA
jgi:hypothetical protein